MGKYMSHFGLGQHLLSPLFDPNAAGCRWSDPLGATGLGNLDFLRLNTKGDWSKAYEAACSWMVHCVFFRKRAAFWRSMEWSMKKTLAKSIITTLNTNAYWVRQFARILCLLRSMHGMIWIFLLPGGWHDVMTWNLHCTRSWLDWLDRSWVTTGPVAQL